MSRTVRSGVEYSAVPTVNGQNVVLDNDGRLANDRTRPISIGSTAPASPFADDLWLNPDSGELRRWVSADGEWSLMELYMWDGAEWVSVTLEHWDGSSWA